MVALFLEALEEDSRGIGVKTSVALKYPWGRERPFVRGFHANTHGNLPSNAADGFPNFLDFCLAV